MPSWRSSLPLLLVLASCAALPERGLESSGFERVTQINSIVGVQMLREEASWSPTEDQIVFGLDWAERIQGLPLRLEGGLHYSWDETDVQNTSGDTVELRHALYEFSAGFLATPWSERFTLRPYLGFGGSIVHAAFDTSDDDEGIEDRDTVFGGYLKAGLLLRLRERAHFGLELRSFRGPDVGLGGIEASTDYDTIALVFGATIGS